MYFVLRKAHGGTPTQFLAADRQTGASVTTGDLQQAAWFKLSLEVTHHEGATTGEVKLEIAPPGIPKGLSGPWEIVFVDLKLS